MNIQIGSRFIGPENPPFIVAELSGNHNGSLKRLLRLVDAAADAGADAVKLQTYTPETMTLNSSDPAFLVDKGPWTGEKLWDLYARAQTPWRWHAKVQARCKELGLEFFSTPFDLTAVAFLKDLGVPAYKISSFEIGDLELIKACAATGKPVLISTGMAATWEINKAKDAALGLGILLHCISDYPANPERMGLCLMPRLGGIYGLSDHSPGHETAIAAVALGASVIEKHLCLSRRAGGVDADFSMEPREFAELTRACRSTWRAMQPPRGPVSVQGNDRYRRGLWIVQPVAKGEVVTASHIRALRPAGKLSPIWINNVIGRRAAYDLSPGTAVDVDMLK